MDAKRTEDVAEVLSARPKPRKEDVQEFFNPWGVKQKSQKKPRPLPECIQELSTKVIEATNKLQQDLSSMVSSAEQPGASSAMSPATQHLSFDILLASQRCNELDKNFLRPKPPSKSDPMQQRPKEAFVRVAGMVPHSDSNGCSVFEAITALSITPTFMYPDEALFCRTAHSLFSLQGPTSATPGSQHVQNDVRLCST